MIGQTIPAVDGLKFVKGEPFPVGGPVPAGKKIVTVVEFWATWCGPCRSTIPHLSEVVKRFAKKDVNVVGVTDEQDEAKITAFASQMGMEYPVAIDGRLEAKSKIFRPSGARGIPHAVVIGVDGKVVWMGHPMDPQFESTLAAQAALATDRGAPPVELKPLPLVTETFEELVKKPVSYLKGLLNERKIDYKDCVEKADLARRVVEKASSVVYYAEQ
ncbi:hypothetical protein HDU96_009434 [Phlyctochytrium bullatum]|nr:hypothetical protein HDU96_009434 [Phlyctochytrium bullatum]